MIWFRCHVGQAYSSGSLLSLQAGDIEKGLWLAIRALEEKADLARRMAFQARQQNRMLSEVQFLERAQEAQSHADMAVATFNGAEASQKAFPESGFEPLPLP
ncbi:MAG: hypothetical protein SFY66_25590 [Oculatellaceae cyanobacterium bins.114]|nr:hypothetical protein [Oculatellaceae cyanobacterium bins.114]